MAKPYDALLLVSFGGPEGPDDVMPFLENVLRGKNVPRERMLEVAEHYRRFGGISPINQQNRALLTALVGELNRQGPNLPVYWGNRNWHPLLPDTVQQMADDGVKNALAFVTSSFGSYSGCKQYLEDIERAREELGDTAPSINKLRLFFNHPGFIEAVADRTKEAIAELPEDRSGDVRLLFTAHSIPNAMADTCDYVAQLNESCRLVAESLGDLPWDLVYQSRSGPPSQPWLEPDVCDYLRETTDRSSAMVLVPIGFLSDHIEVLYDLDTEARQTADEEGILMIRAATLGTHPRFVSMIRELVVERMSEAGDRAAIGSLCAPQHKCPADCCDYRPQRPSRP
jgi:ferrochelatase